MRIKQRLQLNVVVSVLIAVAICLVLSLSFYLINKANNTGKIAGELMISALERVTLRNDYIRNNSTRAKEQVFAKHAQIGALLKSASKNFQNAEDKQNIAELIGNHEAVGKIFSAIVANREKNGLAPGAADLAREAEERLLNLLNMKVYEVVIHGRELRASSIEARAFALRLAGGGVIFALLILITTAVISSWTMSRAITIRIGRLRDGTSLIGDGNLDHRINLDGDDEFVELSQAFNAMTAKLSDSYHDLATEIGERTQAEAALKKLNEELQIIIDSSPAMIFYKDCENRFIRVNKALAEATGLPREAMKGKRAAEIYPNQAKDYWEDDKEVITTGKPKIGIIEPIDGPTGTRWLRTDKVPYRDKEDRIIGIIGFAIDITERKQAEEALKKLNEELEMRVAERTENLRASMESLQIEINHRKQAEERLQVTLANLERSNKELEQFAYVASHDLQEPLRMVSSYTQLLAQRYEGQLDDKANKFIGYAVDGAIRMQRLINDLLAYSRVNTQGKTLETIDSHAVFGQTLRNLAATIKENQALIITDDLPTVRADATQLSQLFQNLIGNAIKFQGGDLPRIHVSACDLGHEWRFSVTDNGIGIDEQYKEKVFVIFQRLHTRQEYPGTGIGLAICKRIVERHGGRIWFESEAGKGSTFYFTLPKGEETAL